jgi:hypothetical protein
MGNAGEEMQALAARHDWAMTLSNDEDGVAETLEPLIRRAQQAQSATRHAGNNGSEVVTSQNSITSR